ncbi:dephospho-CoA kinase [Paenibacillus psychroresistens]|uniref:Dephospho-CoA kinase n=1 Tax=Paenibacillus psychroresistens TaxID=1778678 RepID=A0A6B8RP00_9BACL|nr:dephospho-CoA kinase [Paenibacillus psychroresistens]QGQ97577.1 dephospho-CoA kinase [Paenibacillus psychroresistens]
MNIGLTGGIACGKSTVASMLVHLGAKLIDADQLAREVVMPGRPALQQIADRFGPEVIFPDGTLHRKALGAIIFNEPTARKDLDDITHPVIRQAMWDQMHKAEEADPDRLVVVDVPLLFESMLQSYFQKVMVVYVSEKLQLQRLMERDKLTLEEAKLRLKAQMPIEEKKQLADIVIDNSGDLAETEKQIQMFWQRKGER